MVIDKSHIRITNGIWSDFATMAVRTGGPGVSGISLLVVPLLNHPGVTMRRMKTTGGTTSGTTFIDLEDVKVPVDNLIGLVGTNVILNGINRLHSLTQ
jgi:acyl-CoA dehydrogenase